MPTVHQKRFRMILPQCATYQEKVLFESSGPSERSDDLYIHYFHVRPFHCHVHNHFSYLICCFEFGDKTRCGVAMAIMIFNEK